MNSEQFKRIRVSKGYTQQELADFLGFKVLHISRLENGHKISKVIEMAMKNLPKNGGK